jgi:hypothetical protein
MLRRVALVRADVSEEPSASFIRVTRIGELGTTLAATSNRRTLRRNTWYFFKNKRKLYGGINEFKRDYQPGNNLVTDEN